MQEVIVKCVVKEPITERYVMVLESKEGKSFIPINIGAFEAEAIYTQLNGIISPKPMTYDFFAGILAVLDNVNVQKVVIDEVEGDIYSASIMLNHSGGLSTIKCRPSDAIALGLRKNTPLYVKNTVIKEACCCSKGCMCEGEKELLEEILSDQQTTYWNV